MAIIGFANEVHTPLIMTYSLALAISFGYSMYFNEYVCFVIGVPIIARSINSRYLIVFDHKPRIYIACLGILAAYAIVSVGVFDPLKTPERTMWLLSIAVIIANSSTSIGEATMYGYLKGIPQELIFMYNLGK